MASRARKNVGSRKLKNRLGTYLRAVRAGTTIVVTDRGIPIAELRPLPAGARDLPSRLAEAAARGVITLGSRGTLRPRVPLRIAGPPLSQTILEDREDRA